MMNQQHYFIEYFVKALTFKALPTTIGAKYNPISKLRLNPKLGPISLPCPGTFSLSAHNLIKSFFPQIYAPLLAIPAPKFFIREPTTISALTSVGSNKSHNSQ